MEVDELWEFIEPRLDRMEKKIDKANGRSSLNSLSIKGLWGVFSIGCIAFYIWLKSKI